MNKLPVARVEDIVVQEVGNEILIYDLKTNKAYNLNETCSIVYKNCDGRTTFSELKAKSKFTDDIIYLTLDELKKDDLIEADNSIVSPFAGMNRREVIRRVGLASMIALPFVTSLVAPTAAMAQSCKAQQVACTSSAQCCSSAPNCNGGRCCVGSGTLLNNTVIVGGGGTGCPSSASVCNASTCCSGSARVFCFGAPFPAGGIAYNCVCT